MNLAQPAAEHAGTGRLVAEISPRTQRVVYGDPSPRERSAELSLMALVDKAHLTMLAATGLISPAAAAGLLGCIAKLSEQGFRPLSDRPAPRGLYLMYEGYLIEALGPDIGGVLHTGRSRNDLKACITALRLRAWVLDFGEQANRLTAVLLSRARAYRSVVMPVYTHYQAAMPVSYGYYLLGLATAVERDLDALVSAADGLQRCPLGAGAVAGTDLAIDQDLTAGLLGFTAGSPHALDAVASRDVALRVLGAVSSLTITLSRLASDLQLWSTAEFGFLEFPDRLVGGSSAMPQKRNAFLLEHLKAKSGQAIGAWTAAAGMMTGTPFSNSIEVGTEAMASVWQGLDAGAQAVLLAQLLVGGARPVPDRMAERAESGFTAATAIANRLVQQGMPFRGAHRLVGDAVRRAVAAGSTKLAEFGPPGWLDGIGLTGLDLGELVEAQRHGGGPGNFDEPFGQACRGWQHRRRHWAQWREQLAAAAARLEAAVAELVSQGADPAPDGCR
ncbi:MAG: argininosuccinate lyase [Pseudonocardiales bacterium]|nr:argininosuccinate lyase [Pseudonocardiales bacterium]